MTFRVLPEAIADILAIANYIKVDNPQAAAKLIEQFYMRFRSLDEMPGMGIQRPEISDRVRSLPVGNYLILYHQEPHGVDIIRVVHGMRDIENLS
jgi:toxin ParE1/3/4